MGAKWSMLLVIAACDSGTPKPVAPPPLPPPAPPVDAPIPEPSPMPTAKIAEWSSEVPSDRVPSASCIRAADRFVQYADLHGESAARFCIWFHLSKAGAADVGCWRVDLTDGSYHPEGGVWFSSPQPEHDDKDGSTTAGIADGPSATALESTLTVGSKKVALPGKGSIVLAREKDFVVIDRDGRVLLVDASAKITRTFTPQPCKP